RVLDHTPADHLLRVALTDEHIVTCRGPAPALLPKTAVLCVGRLASQSVALLTPPQTLSKPSTAWPWLNGVVCDVRCEEKGHVSIVAGREWSDPVMLTRGGRLPNGAYVTLRTGGYNNVRQTELRKRLYEGEAWHVLVQGHLDLRGGIWVDEFTTIY